MSDRIFGFLMGILMTTVLCLLILAFRLQMNTRDFKDITSRIVVYEKYDDKNLESKKAAFDKCSKILTDNGYTVSTMDVEYNMGCFVVVVGTKKEN